MLAFYSKKQHFKSDGLPFQIVFHNQINEILHYHDFDELVIVLDGNGIHETKSMKSVISAGDVFLIKQGQQHIYTHMKNLSIVNILFEYDKLEIDWNKFKNIQGFTALFETEPNLRERTNFRNKHTLNPEQLDQISALLYKMKNEFDGKKSGWDIMMLNLLQELFIMLARSYSATTQKNSKYMVCLTRMTQFIENNYAKDITRDMIIHAGKTSTAVGTRIFKELLGQSPVEYLNHIRLNHAVDMLQNTDAGISEIAYACGFGDSNYFSLRFKKKNGISPRAFRNNIKSTEK